MYFSNGERKEGSSKNNREAELEFNLRLTPPACRPNERRGWLVGATPA